MCFSFGDAFFLFVFFGFAKILKNLWEGPFQEEVTFHKIVRRDVRSVRMCFLV